MRRAYVRGLGPMLAWLLVVSCGGATTESSMFNDGATAQLRAFHAAANVGMVDVRIGGVPLVTGLGYGQSSAEMTVPAGPRQLTFTSGGHIVGQVSIDLSAKQKAVVGLSADTALVFPAFSDTGAYSPTRANIRIVNMASAGQTKGTLVRAEVVIPSYSAQPYMGYTADISEANYGPYLNFDPNHFVVRFLADGSTTVLASVEFDVAAGQAKDVVLERGAADELTAKVVVEQ